LFIAKGEPEVRKVLKVLHWLNFDTALGAVFTSMFVAQFLNAAVPFTSNLALFITVLIIYNFDHLIDARSIKRIAQSARHNFYQKNLYILSLYQIALLVAALFLVWYLPPAIIRAGIILGLITAIYFLLLFIIFPKRFMLKEIMISIVFSCAIFLAPYYSHQPLQFSLSGVLLWSEILILAITNTFIFSWYDYDIDQSEGHTSIAVVLGRRTVGLLIYALFFTLVIIVTINLTLFGNWGNQFVVLLMAGLLYFSYVADKSLSRNEFYRVFGDAVFLLPIIGVFT
jgi:hypothetical protein